VASVLVFRIGNLGDTLVGLPAMWAVREHYADSRITVLCNARGESRYIVPTDVLDGSGICDDFLLYPTGSFERAPLRYPVEMMRLLMELRRRRFNVLVYLVPSRRSARQISRDRQFFRLAGIKTLIGMGTAEHLPHKTPGEPLPMVPREGDLLLARLAAAGIPVPPAGIGRTDVGLGQKDSNAVSTWLRGLPGDGDRPWISVGPGSKQPAKLWPEERFERVVDHLIRRFDVWPVVFGSEEDRRLGDRLTEAWGRGYNASGRLGVREAMMAMRRCVLHLGNDTGTMHMAAAVNVRCVAVFSSHNLPGTWYPYGEGHVVLRTAVDCEGCQRSECGDQGMRCILAIAPETVTEACAKILRSMKSTASALSRDI